MRIAFLGDTHYCIPREGAGARWAPDLLPDHQRYTPMAESVLKPLLAQVRAAAPDLLISSGDFVEGGLRGEPVAARREMVEGLAYFTDLDCPFLIARGTHDAPDLFAELAVPAIADSVGAQFAQTYFRHDVADCAFLILDYQHFAVGNDQDMWLEAQLVQAAEADRRIFVVAHAPVYLWGRHFFGEAALIGRLDELFTDYPVEAYLCGHTHNQILSFHARQGDKGWLQLMASSVGYAAMPGQSLEKTHCLADFGPDNACLWGIAEDSAPGFYTLDLMADGMHVSWQSVADEHRDFSVEAIRTMPVCLDAEPELGVPTPEDLLQIKSAVLGVFGYSGATPAGEVCLNGISLGALPANGAYAARRFLTVPGEALTTIGYQNTLTVRTPDCDAFAIGSFVLELSLLDGRVLRSPVVPEILVAGNRWQAFPGERRLVPCAPRQECELSLPF